MNPCASSAYLGRDTLAQRDPQIVPGVGMPLRAVCFISNHAALSGSVLDVLFMSAYPEVRRVATGWVIASMANIEFLGEWAMGQDIHDAMRTPNSLGDSDHPITKLISWPGPLPTS